MKLKEIKLNKTTGKKTIAQATDVFSYIDSDFKNWNLDVPSKPTKAVTLDVHEMDKDGTFKDIFTNPEKQAMTQEQIIEFCKNHKEDLRIDGYATFFLFKRDSDFFVAIVYFDDYGRLEVYVRGFSYDDVWHAKYQHRFVSLQLPLEILESKESLSTSESLTLDSAIKLVKENGLLVFKPM